MAENKALIYCTNIYPYVTGGNLRGCINDLYDYQATLAAKGFSCITLSDGMTTAGRIRAELNILIGNAKPGDHLVVAGSSHGSYATDQNGDEIDRKDELTCTYDFPRDYIRDDELRAIFVRLPANVTLDVFFDRCYSGTSTRLAPQSHKIPVLGNRYLPFTGKPRKVAEKAIEVSTMKENLFAACGEGQTSAEVSVNGIPRGLFSYYVCKALRGYPSYTRDQIMNYCRTKVSAVVPGQTPQLECQAANAAKLPFA